MKTKLHGTVLLVHPDGRLERIERDFPMGLEFLQKTVGGWIEGVCMSEEILAVINEEGRLPHMGPLPDNARYPNLCGPVLLCSRYDYPGEDGDPPEPDFGPLTEAQLRMLEGGGVAPGHTPYMDRTKTIPDEDLRIRIIDPSEGKPRGKG